MIRQLKYIFLGAFLLVVMCLPSLAGPSWFLDAADHRILLFKNIELFNNPISVLNKITNNLPLSALSTSLNFARDKLWRGGTTSDPERS